MDSSISVIIPVYNRLDTLRDAIESLLMQTVKPLEIIVVN
ncbi:MAG: glycosyltransferase, partial [Mucispirillum sp.]|nr:glycosyltransferase [Mucispirillum sp.]